LFAIVLVLHGSAVSGGWRFDDAAHLLFVLKYSVAEYFLIPKVMYEQSFANVTPWNALTYDLNLALFGPRPQYFYVHQLTSLWLASVALFWLARKYMTGVWAMLTAILFVVSGSSAHIAQELMTGHYVEGLLFTVLSIGFLCQPSSPWKYWLSVFFYVLAVNCKEVYVPLPLLLFFLPGGITHSLQTEALTLKSAPVWFLGRLRFLLPFFAVLVLYLIWRHQILGGIVSSRFASVSLLVKIEDFVSMVPKFGMIVFGADLFSTIATLVSLALMAIGLIAPWRVSFVVGAVVLLIPLVQLASTGSIGAPNRYYFALWAGFSYFVGLIGSTASSRVGRGAVSVAAIVILFATVRSGVEETRVVGQMGRAWEESYRFASCDGDKSRAYFVPDSGDLVEHAYWDEMMTRYSAFSTGFSSDKQCKPPSFVNFTLVLKHLRSSPMTSGEVLLKAMESSEVLTYGQDCECIRHIRMDEVTQRSSKLKYRFVEDPMSIEYRYDADHRMLDMKLGPYPDSYKVLFTDRSGNVSFFELPWRTYKGQIDATIVGDLKVFHLAEDGKITRSPSLPFPPPAGGFAWHQ
jgi:hypothetical protein